tara:strand:- start:518 stop:718 length:201 start_codon:yes stop_codon:yes gene_type:complete
LIKNPYWDGYILIIKAAEKIAANAKVMMIVLLRTCGLLKANEDSRIVNLGNLIFSLSGMGWNINDV